MEEFDISWYLFTKIIVPYSVAHLVLGVYIYLTLVKQRMTRVYRYYSTFLLCFAFQLTGPVLNALPLDYWSVVLHFVRNVLFFTVAVPALVCGLFIHCRIALDTRLKSALYGVGVAWSIFYLLFANATNPILAHPIPWAEIAEQLLPVTHLDIYYSQIGLVLLQLALPCLFLLKHKNAHYARVYIFSSLNVALFVAVGNAFEAWQLYYTGAGISALAWGAAMFHDVRNMNEKVREYLHQKKSLSKAQFMSEGNHSDGDFVDMYPSDVDEAYPFRERESLIAAVTSGGAGVVEEHCEHLTAALAQYCHNELAPYKARAREVLFLMVDGVIFHGGNAKQLVQILQNCGRAISDSDAITSINQLLLEAAIQLAEDSQQRPAPRREEQLVVSIQAFVLGHYHQDISIEHIAEQVGSSRSNIVKVFKQETGKTLNQYLVEVRINKAKEFLLVKTVTETAYEVGFNNSNYFATVFKKHTGKTPSQYQQQAKGDA